MFNLVEQGLNVQKAIVEANSNVIPFPTRQLVEELRKNGLVLVHKPASLKTFNDGDDFPPLDAA